MITGTLEVWDTCKLSREIYLYPSSIFVILCEASNCFATKSSSFFILFSLSTFFFSCCITTFLTFIALPQNYLFTCLKIYKDCFFTFFSSSFHLCYLICSNLLHVLWANLAIFLFNFILSSRSDAKSLPAYSTCLSKYLHFVIVDGSYNLCTLLPNCL